MNRIDNGIVNETLTCTAGQIREYVFPNLRKHEISLAFVVGATVRIAQTNVYRNASVTGGVKVYSPVNQDVEVMLVLFGTAADY